MRAHPYANKFPMHSEDMIEELAESIKANGLRQPIVLDTEGRILDGRARAAACDLADVEPETVTYEGDDLAEYVIDCNINRDDMSTGARAMVVALILIEDGRRKNGLWTRGALDFTGSGNNSEWRQRITDAGFILDYAPHLTKVVAEDRLVFHGALEEAQEIKAEQERQQCLLAELQQAQALQWLECIDSGEMDLPTAYAAWKEATRKQREETAQLNHSRTIALRGVTDAVNQLQGGTQQAEIWIDVFLPYMNKLLDPYERLTVARVQSAIDQLSRIREELNQPEDPTEEAGDVA